jgi:hypothetical protein
VRADADDVQEKSEEKEKKQKQEEEDSRDANDDDSYSDDSSKASSTEMFSHTTVWLGDCIAANDTNKSPLIAEKKKTKQERRTVSGKPSHDSDSSYLKATRNGRHLGSRGGLMENPQSQKKATSRMMASATPTADNNNDDGHNDDSSKASSSESDSSDSDGNGALSRFMDASKKIMKPGSSSKHILTWIQQKSKKLNSTAASSSHTATNDTQEGRGEENTVAIPPEGEILTVSERKMILDEIESLNQLICVLEKDVEIVDQAISSISKSIAEKGAKRISVELYEKKRKLIKLSFDLRRRQLEASGAVVDKTYTLDMADGHRNVGSTAIAEKDSGGNSEQREEVISAEAVPAVAVAVPTPAVAAIFTKGESDVMEKMHNNIGGSQNGDGWRVTDSREAPEDNKDGAAKPEERAQDKETVHEADNREDYEWLEDALRNLLHGTGQDY